MHLTQENKAARAGRYRVEARQTAAGAESWLPSRLLAARPSQLMGALRDADPVVYGLLARSASTDAARREIAAYLDRKEAAYFDVDSPERLVDANITERSNAKECIRVMRNIIRTENEVRTGFSALQALRDMIRHAPNVPPAPAFVSEFIALLHGVNASGLSLLADDRGCSPEGHEAILDGCADDMERSFRRFVKGTDPALVARQSLMKRRILAYFGATEADWEDYQWHLRHLFTGREALASLVHLESDEIAGLDKASETGIPVQITPYYLSLFNPGGRDRSDRAVRAQVLPSVSYCMTVARNRIRGADMDYMGEQSTSPVPCITRRYPRIVILKPFDSCPQICVYCQRNWEIRDLEHGAVSAETTSRAIAWIRDHEEISEVLVTGGDPLTLDNAHVGRILDQLADIAHIERIRIGTRTPVTVPCRIDSGLLSLLRAYHRPGRREMVIMTHVEHSAELTPELAAAVSRIRACGVSVYNQQVFTYYNSRRFETAFLRRNLRLCGIDPYYTFNTKGKEETADFRVPIARLLQERKEEARLLPGVARTDEPVFNVPRLGKSHLRAWQDHEPIMILDDGRRVYRFLPWESRLALSDDYLYTDVAIYDYLERLHLDGEDVDRYRSIWYYF